MSPVQGVDAVTVQLWEECAAVGTPRAVVVTQLDKPRADFDEAVAVCQRVLGEGVHPLHLPMLADDESVAGLIGLLDQKVQDYSSGTRVERDADPQHLPLLETLRGELIEAVIAESEDETLLDRYLAGEDVELSVLTADLETAVARGHFHPVLPVAPLSGVGLDELLDLLVAGFPTPLEHPSPPVTRPDGSPAEPLGCDPDGPLAAEVVRTTTDPYLGRVSLVRVFCGTLRPDLPVHVSGHGGADRGHPDHDADERVGALSSPLGAAMRPVGSCPAGDVCVVARLSTAETGDTLSSPATPLLVAPWDLPEPQHPVAVTAASRADEDKLAAALSRLVAEDPVVRLAYDPETGQQVLWCVGESHAEVLARPAADPARRLRRHPAGAGRPASRRCAARRPRPGATSSSPAATGSSPSRSSRWLPCRPAAGWSSTPAWSAGRCRRRSSAASRRACARRWSAACTPAARWSTCRSRWSTARRTRSTPPTRRSRRPGRWRSGRPRPRRAPACSSRTPRSPSPCRPGRPGRS